MWTKKNIAGQAGKTVVITGANTGIGYETALALYEAGAHVVLACRNVGKANEAIEKMKTLNGAGTLEAALLDLSGLQKIEQFAENFLKDHKQLHLLINNAGVMIPPASRTEEGYELQFGVNFIGHFALTGRLYSLLKSTPGARVVTLSSMAYLRGNIDFDNLKSEKDYDPMREYCQSKLADLLFSTELQHRIDLTKDDILSVAAQPGANNTELSRHMTSDEYDAAIERIGELMEPWQGALPSLYAAVMPGVKGGELYGPDQDGGYRGYPGKAEIAPHALDRELARKLWKAAEEITGIHYPET